MSTVADPRSNRAQPPAGEERNGPGGADVDAGPDAIYSPGLLRAMRIAAWSSLLANIGICVTGAAVRLTNSGLGCPTWPNCVPGSITPVEATFHEVVEFSNRLLTFVVLAAAVACVVLALRHRPWRPQQVPLALGLIGGIFAQIVIGGAVVLLHLAPLSVSLHFLASAALVAVSAWLLQRTWEGDAPARATVPPIMRTLALGLVTVLAVLLVVGTIVTASGPNGGDPVAARLNLNMQYLAWLHADLVFVAVGLTIGLLVAARVAGAPRTLWRRCLILLGLMFVQGTIGYVQYFTNLPVVLVGFHVLGSVTVWAAGVLVLAATRFRAGYPGPDVPEPPALAASAADAS